VKRDTDRRKWIEENPLEAYAAAQYAMDMWTDFTKGLTVRDIFEDAPKGPSSPLEQREQVEK
jgi:hypothetical protein